MTKLTKYRVVREHQGDKDYAEGDERIAAAADVKHLIPNCLEEIGPADEPDDGAAENAEPAPQDKAEDAAPANKAITGRKPKQAQGADKGE